MSQGFFSALALVAALLLEYTLMAALPSPWRDIALPLLFGIVIMYRVSLSLGAVFLLSAGVLTYGRDLADFDLVIAYGVAALMGIALSSRVFARRSLAALTGFAFGTTLFFLLTKFFLSLSKDIVAGESITSGMTFLNIVFIVFASVIGVTILSILYTTLLETFGRRFIQKDLSYEIQTRV